MNDLRRKSIRPWVRGAALLAVAILIGWFLGTRLGGDDSPDPAIAAGEGGSQIYRDVGGRIVRVAPEDGVMTVDHEAIGDLMPAMVMDIQLAVPNELAPFSPGDEITFDLILMDGTIQAVRLRSADGARSSGEGAGDVPADPLGRGDLLPDLELYDAAGDVFRLSSMEPRNKVITFFYARCPLQDFCPTQSQQLARLQQRITPSEDAVHLVSLTLDAENDTPALLAEYAERFRADPARWTIAGGDDGEAIRRFAHRAGARIQRDESGPWIDHALIALRVDGDRIVDFVYGLEAMEALVEAM